VALIPDEVLDEIRERIDLVALIEESVRLKKAGTSHKGLCPFHNEKTPSFHVNPVRRSFYCFGCQKHGDAVTFIREIKGLTFVEAAHELARRAGVTIPEREATPEERARMGERRLLLDVNGATAAYFRENLFGPRGAPARDYLSGRGIHSEIAEVFQLGYATDDWEGLAQRLQQRRLPVQAASTLGLCAQGRRGWYDLFRNRVVCPVTQREGEVLGFSGRTLSADDPRKYYNSPESPLYRKSNLVFGLAQARPSLHRKGRAIVVEGNFDVVALHQAGLTETVAPLGTALTEQQVEILRKLAPQVVLCLDGDKAGRAATLRAIPLLVAAGVDTRVVRLPDGEDPDSFVRKQGVAALEALIAGARTSIEHFLDEVWFRTDRSADALAGALRETAPLILSVGDDIKQQILVDKVALALQVDVRIVRRALADGEKQAVAERQTRAQIEPKGLPSEPQAHVAPRPPTSPPKPEELSILAILADHPELYSQADQIGAKEILTDVRLRDMYSAAQQGKDLLDVTPLELRDLVVRKVLGGQFRDVPNPLKTLQNAVATLARGRLDAEVRDVRRRILEAEQRGDETLAHDLVRKLQTLKEAAQRPEEESR
jgi:DNA primase